MIHCFGVSKRYQDGKGIITALADLELHLAPGTATALVGRSGSGKSTLLHLMGGLDIPDAGRVFVAGSELGALSDADLTRFRLAHIGFVFQFFHLIPSLTVLENLLLPTELAGWAPARRRQRVRERLDEVGLAERGGAYPDQLSGGEQQRIAVARALLMDPPVLLADEPTGNLDAENGARVLEVLWRLARERGSTLVVATHSAEVAGRCGRRIELNDGRLANDSAPEPPPAALPGRQQGAPPAGMRP